MADHTSPNDDLFSRKEAAGTPLMSAVEELCRRNPGYSLAGMEQMTLGEIFDLARETYSEQLPEFWRIWNDWSQPGLEQPMGDL
jgi:hypothetical protein